METEEAATARQATVLEAVEKERAAVVLGEEVDGLVGAAGSEEAARARVE